ncbi:hypothetical protein MPDQ_001708 [Monascus purpureus]|uniref:SH3 domain-containing protein n=1 Tax=Monascus purpureus TaxID=5098 RepID=A0A507QNV6_MONPU|nr:hypothetical protein MPDQ_001708 [Monascus purpureus]
MPSPPFTVKAIFEYSSSHDDDLTFAIGQVVTVTAEEDEEWYYGEYTDNSGVKHEGIFPKNFVERYEPPAPPRPSRPSRLKKEPEPVSPPEPAIETPAPVESMLPPEPEVPETKQTEYIPQQPQSPRLPASINTPSSPAKQAPVSSPSDASAAPAPKPVSKPPPPAVAEKPTGSSFKDRIAAFNRPAEPPIAPFKPTHTSFVKKPFVAPPPSKNSFVPPPRQPPTKIYRREDDPEVAERLARETPVSESRPNPNEAAAQDTEEQPKPTSLKERIALLQKQQLEQAARHAEAAHRKEKPKKPKKPVEQHPQSEQPELEKAAVTEAAPGNVADVAKEAVTPHPPPQELLSDANDADYSAAADTEDAESSTSKDDNEDAADASQRRGSHAPKVKQAREENGGQEKEEEDEAEEEEEEEEEIDPEVKRRMEIRARMAKMSGGMGMMGFFGPPGGMPLPGSGARKPKAATEPEKHGDSERGAPAAAPPVPIMALPGMNTMKPPAPAASPEGVEKEEEEPHVPSVTEQHPPHEVSDIEEVVQNELRQDSSDVPPSPPPHKYTGPPPPPVETRPAPPVSASVPPERPLPTPSAPAPPVPAARSVPPPPGKPFDTGEDSDDELSTPAQNPSVNTAAPSDSVVTPLSETRPSLERLESRRSSIYSTGMSPTYASEKRHSRPPPPIPTSPPLHSPLHSRAPPPPPPGNLSRVSTADSRASAASAPRQAGEVEGEITEYDGDYDTDIASGAKFKDALKAHGRDSSLDEDTTADDRSIQSPGGPAPDSRPPPPPPHAPRAVPPPPPSQPPKAGRASVDLPRGPPPPPPKEQPIDNEDEYDPFRYTSSSHGLPPPPPIPSGRPESVVVQPEPPRVDYDDLYEASPVHSPSEPQLPTSPQAKRLSVAPPPPPSQPPAAGRPPSSRTARASMDFPRSPLPVRRSMDVSRPSIDQGYIAMDIDLAEATLWWTRPNTPPPVFQNRKDLLLEVEESSSSQRGGRTMVTKDIYVLFLDYSQTVISVRFDARNPSDASLEQRHEPPPHPPRQDQLERAHVELGARISEAAEKVQHTTVADGTPFGLIEHLLKPLPHALLPIGTRAFGALVYANLANASVQQNDEIRPGDIVSFRNARFQGHRGTMHQKYSSDVGKPDHVGVVVDWDGTKKKIRAWEQGRESKKVKVESFKLNDMRSGECKVWRVMPRSWIGWESVNQ